MKNFITARLLAGRASAENSTSRKDCFPGSPDVNSYVSNPNEVLRGRELRSTHAALKSISGSYPDKATMREIHQYPGLDVSGIDKNSDFDLSISRKFADSFRVLPQSK